VRVFVYLRFQKFVLAEGYATQNFGNVTPWKIPLNSLSKYVIVSYKCGSSLFFFGIGNSYIPKKEFAHPNYPFKKMTFAYFSFQPFKNFFFLQICILFFIEAFI